MVEVGTVDLLFKNELISAPCQRDMLITHWPTVILAQHTETRLVHAEIFYYEKGVYFGL